MLNEQLGETLHAFTFQSSDLIKYRGEPYTLIVLFRGDVNLI